MGRRTIVLVVMLAAVGVLALGAAPAMAQYPPEEGGLTLSTDSAAPGGTVDVSGSGFKAFSTVTLTITCPGEEADSLGTTTADSSGDISETVTLPSDLEDGTCTIKASGVAPDDSVHELTADITIDSTLVETGGPEEGGITAGALAGILAGIVVLAGAIVALARPRREEEVRS